MRITYCCECDLYIKGPKEQLDEFLFSVKTERSAFDFNQLIPFPVHFHKQDRLFDAWIRNPPEKRTSLPPLDGHNRGGYEWSEANWGTQWNAIGASLKYGHTWENEGRTFLSMLLTFATACSPPKPVIEHASARFPDLVFDLRYFERGMQFNGMFVCERGKVTSTEVGPYHGKRGGCALRSEE